MSSLIITHYASAVAGYSVEFHFMVWPQCKGTMTVKHNPHH